MIGDLHIVPGIATIPPTYEGVPIGVTGFYVGDGLISEVVPGVSYVWNVVGVTGYLEGKGGFADCSFALADVVLPANPCTVLNPTLSVKHPDLWVGNSTVKLGLTVFYLGKSVFKDFVVTFSNGFTPGAPVTLNPSSKYMLFNTPTALGVSGFTVAGCSLAATVGNLAYPGVAYEWSVVDADGYAGFTNKALAMGNIGIANKTVLNPTLTVGTPTNWPNGSRVVLALAITWNGITNNTARLTVFNGSGWYNGVEIKFDPPSCVRSPRNAALGITGYVSPSAVPPEMPTYSWDIDDIEGLDMTSFGSLAYAKSQVTLVNGTTISPTLLFHDPDRWPDGVKLKLKATLLFDGIYINADYRIVLKSSAWEESPRVILVPGLVRVDPYTNATLDIKGFSAIGSEVTHTSGVAYQWSVVSATGYRTTGAVSFGSEDAAMADVHFVAGTDTMLRPTLYTDHPYAWQNGSVVTLSLAVSHGGMVVSGTIPTVMHHVFTAATPIRLKNASRDAYSGFTRIGTAPNTATPLDIGGWDADHSLMGANVKSDVLTYLWSVDSVSGYNAGTLTTPEQAKNNVVITNGNTLTPSVHFSTPIAWPSQARITLALRLTLTEAAGQIVTNSNARHTVIIGPQSGATTSGFSPSTHIAIAPAHSTAIVPTAIPSNLTGDDRFFLNVTDLVVGGDLSAGGVPVYSWAVKSPNPASLIVSSSGLRPQLYRSNSVSLSEGTSATLVLTVSYNGVANSTAEYTVQFYSDALSRPEGVFGNGHPMTVSQTSSSPMYSTTPYRLDTIARLPSGSMTEASFRWSLDHLENVPAGFADESEALGDIIVCDQDRAAPILVFKTPSKWNANTVYLRLHAMRGNLVNSTGVVGVALNR